MCQKIPNQNSLFPQQKIQSAYSLFADRASLILYTAVLVHCSLDIYAQNKKKKKELAQ